VVILKEKIEKYKWIIIVILIILIGYFVNNSSFIEKIGSAIYPFLLGAIFAFIINIPMNFIEKKIFHLKKKKKRNLYL